MSPHRRRAHQNRHRGLKDQRGRRAPQARTRASPTTGLTELVGVPPSPSHQHARDLSTVGSVLFRRYYVLLVIESNAGSFTSSV
jgi:hypothetical protein